VYLLEGADGLTLIDASIPPATQGIVRQLTAAGRQLSDVRRILITHAHPDHVGALSELRRLTGAQVLASALEQPVLEGRQPIPRPPAAALGTLGRLFRPGETRLHATPVDRVLADGEVLPEVLNGLQAIATPGHAPGHLAFWQAERRLLFCGDVIFNMFGLGLPFAFFTVDMAENIRSAAKLAALRPELVCFGHGPPLTQQVTQRLDAFVQRVAHP
jgi:glyoxylase-like metal-dependent hydrolase (beta-lactamase superfamily II)